MRTEQTSLSALAVLPWNLGIRTRPRIEDRPQAVAMRIGNALLQDKGDEVMNSSPA